MIRRMDSVSIGPLSRISGHEASSRVSSAVWNTMAVDKAFYKYMDDSVLEEALHSGTANS